MALGDCAADGPGVESRSLERHGVTGLHQAHWLHRWDTASALLDGGDSRIPSAQLRARFLLSVSVLVPFLRRFLACSKFTNTLFATSRGAESVCDCHHFYWPVHVARPSLTSAHGICRDTGDVESEALEMGGVIPFLCCVFSFGLPSDSPSAARATF